MQVAMMNAIASGANAIIQSATRMNAGEGAGGTGMATAPFGSLLTDAVQSVSNLETEARTAVDGMMTGSGVDVHTAMIATQKADMAFELVLAVRSKAVQAYQSVMGMQF